MPNLIPDLLDTIEFLLPDITDGLDACKRRHAVLRELSDFFTVMRAEPELAGTMMAGAILATRRASDAVTARIVELEVSRDDHGPLAYRNCGMCSGKGGSHGRVCPLCAGSGLRPTLTRMITE